MRQLHADDLQLTARALVVAIVVACAAFVAVSSHRAATRGIVAEEAQPYLRRHPLVLEERDRAIVALPPHEDGAPPRPRWVATAQWPIVAYDGRDRMWPAFVRGHQTAVASYVGIALGPLLGGGIGGVRRSTALLGAVIVAATAFAAWRTSRRGAAWALAIVASSFGMIAIARTGYGFEVGSRAAMMIAIALFAPRAPPSRRALVGAACACALAILSRATIAVALVPAVTLLLARRGARPTRRQGIAFVAIAAAVPVVVVAAFALALPFHEGTAPLAGFDVASLGARLRATPRHLVLALAWLGDATSVMGPLARGETTLGRTLWPAAAVAAIPVGAAIVRLGRGVARDGERMLVAALACSAVAAAAFYRGDDQFQLALALEPLLALAVAEQIASLPRAWIGALVGVLALAVRARGVVAGLGLDAANANPMLSGASQRAAVARMSALDPSGTATVTTVYNHAGVPEAWTDGALRPAHAWPLFQGARAPCALRIAWAELLRARRPRFVLLSEGANLYESGATDPAAIRAAFLAVASARGLGVAVERFPTEAGTIGWSLAQLAWDDAPVPLPGAMSRDEAECAIPHDAPAVDVARGVRVGDVAGAFVVASIHTGRGGGEPIAWLVATRGSDGVLFELRDDAPEPPPPARAAGVAVYYRRVAEGVATDDELGQAAVAIAARLAP